MPISAATKPIALFASILTIDLEILFILIFGFGLITFFLILSQYDFKRDNP